MIQPNNGQKGSETTSTDTLLMAADFLAVVRGVSGLEGPWRRPSSTARGARPLRSGRRNPGLSANELNRRGNSSDAGVGSSHLPPAPSSASCASPAPPVRNVDAPEKKLDAAVATCRAVASSAASPAPSPPSPSSSPPKKALNAAAAPSTSPACRFHSSSCLSARPPPARRRRRGPSRRLGVLGPGPLLGVLGVGLGRDVLRPRLRALGLGRPLRPGRLRLGARRCRGPPLRT